MADRVFFVAGSPDEFIRGVSVPQQMISDLLQISRIPPPVIEQIGASVEGAGGFLDDTRLEKLVKKVIPEDDETVADAVVNARAQPAIVLLGRDLECSRGVATCGRSPPRDVPRRSIRLRSTGLAPTHPSVGGARSAARGRTT